MRIYKGTRGGIDPKTLLRNKVRVVWVDLAQDAARRLKGRDTEAQHELDPRFDLRSHSPDGFEWGYEGSGPAQLALALCAHALKVPRRTKEPELGEELPSSEVLCRRVYQDVKRRLVLRLGDQWEVTDALLLALIEEVRVG